MQTLFSDASFSVWDAHRKPDRLLFHVVWTDERSQFHINVRDMMTISMALERALHAIQNTTIIVATDNASVVSYIMKQGWVGDSFSNFVYGITLKVRHIPGRFNILADRLSRMFQPVPTEWCISQTIANQAKVMVSGSTAISSYTSLRTPQCSRPSGSTRKESYVSKPSNACLHFTFGNYQAINH